MLAIAAGVPVIPTIIHGTIEVLPRGSLWVRGGRVDVHLMEPVPTDGLSYDEASGHYRFTEPDYAELYEVVKGNGPCNEERLFWRNTHGRDLIRRLPRHAAVLTGKALRRWQEGRLLPWLLGRIRAAVTR